MFLLLIFLTLLTYFLGKYTKSLVPFYLLTIVLVIISGFRGESIGVDTQNYWAIFNEVNNGGIVLVNELGYLLFIKLITFIGGTQQLIFLIYSIFTILLYNKFILKYSKDPYFSLLIFVFVGPFFLSSFNQIRQYLAIAIFLAYLIPLIKNKQLIKYLVIVVVSTLFIHSSSLLLIPFYFVLNKEISLFKKIFLVIIFNISTSFIISIILLSPYRYLILSRAEIEVGTSLFIISIIISFFFLLKQNKISQRKNEQRIFYNMAYFSIFMIIPIFINNKMPVEIFFRMNNYFFPFIIILLPELLERYNKKSKFIVSNMLILFLTLYFFKNSVILGEVYQLDPYYFNFNLFEY